MGGYGRVLCAVALSAAIPTAVAQQPNCTQRSEFVRHLAETYAEKPIAIGVDDNGSETELLNSKTGNSWSIITTTPDGMAYQVAAGENWQLLRYVETQEH